MNSTHNKEIIIIITLPVLVFVQGYYQYIQLPKWSNLMTGVNQPKMSSLAAQ